MNRASLSSILLGFLGGLVGCFCALTIARHFEFDFVPKSQAQGTRIVEAAEFRLAGKDGKVRAQLSLSNSGGATLSFLDAKGRERMNLGVEAASGEAFQETLSAKGAKKSIFGSESE